MDLAALSAGIAHMDKITAMQGKPAATADPISHIMDVIMSVGRVADAAATASPGPVQQQPSSSPTDASALISIWLGTTYQHDYMISYQWEAKICSSGADCTSNDKACSEDLLGTAAAKPQRGVALTQTDPVTFDFQNGPCKFKKIDGKYSVGCGGKTKDKVCTFAPDASRKKKVKCPGFLIGSQNSDEFSAFQSLAMTCKS